MELFIEILLDLFFGTVIDIGTNKKMPPLIRTICRIITALLIITVILLLLFLGITIIKSNMIAGLMLIGVDIGIFLFIFINIRKAYKHKINKK